MNNCIQWPVEDGEQIR